MQITYLKPDLHLPKDSKLKYHVGVNKYEIPI